MKPAVAMLLFPVLALFACTHKQVEYAGYEDNWSIKAGNSSRPTLVDNRGIQTTEEDNLFYPGCYVNAKIGIWIQNNSYGKRVNANLLGVQFVKDGADLSGGSKVASIDDFGDLGDQPEVAGL